MSGIQIFFLNLNKEIEEAELVSLNARGANVSLGDKKKFIPKNCILWIPELEEAEYEIYKPRYAYKSEEFMVLWDNERYVEENLRDMFRYYQRCTDSIFVEEFWRLILSEISEEITHEEMATSWLMAKRMEEELFPVENNLSHYKKGEQVSFILHGVEIVFSNHAIQRTFERINVTKANFRALVWQMLKDAVPVRTPKQESKPLSVFLYNNDFNWTFALVPISTAKDSYVVVTSFEPSIHWRKKELDLSTPFLEPAE